VDGVNFADTVPECELSADFIKAMQLMMLSVPECRCNDYFLKHKGSMSLRDFVDYIFTGARDNVADYVMDNQKEYLNIDDFIRIFWDTSHVSVPYKDPSVIFAHVLNPVTINHVVNHRCNGIYDGVNKIHLKGLFDPTVRVNEGQIVVVHFAMIILHIDKYKATEIINHQNKEESVTRNYSEVSRIDYTRFFDNRFEWTKTNYQKYRH
jgi:hydrogenase maturation factor